MAIFHAGIAAFLTERTFGGSLLKMAASYY